MAGIPERRRLVLVNRDAKQLRRIAQILTPVSRDLVVRDALSSAPVLGADDLLIINYDQMTPEERAQLLSTPDLTHGGRALFLSDGRCRSDYAALFASGILTNLLAQTESVQPHDLIITVQKLLRRDIFGIEKYFVWGVQPLELLLTRSTQKALAMSEAEKYVETLGINSRLARLFYTVIDEFITNAMYNAPVGANGMPRFAHLPRTAPVQLEEGEGVELKFCYDGNRLGVSVLDPFGSLSQARTLSYLAKCFRGGADQIDEKPGGAGLGLYYIFDAVSGFAINIHPGVKTEMIGLLDVTESYRSFVSKGKSFNMFSVGDADADA